MLLDKFLSEYDFTERHQIVVRADRGAVLRAVRELRPGDVPISGLLMAIRTLGARRRVPDRPILTGLQANGFALLGEVPDEEMVLGTIGQFWRFRPVHRDATNFVAFDEPGFAKAAINFRVTDRGDGTTLITTETRIRCTDPGSRRRFRLYWLFVLPGSALIRRVWLRAIRRRAEAASRAVSARS